ncbi:hypothetical protein QW131_22285 [Roseibium salinum]|nr:hypothetical protein [Roseibium salinum]
MIVLEADKQPVFLGTLLENGKKIVHETLASGSRIKKSGSRFRRAGFAVSDGKAVIVFKGPDQAEKPPSSR